MDSQVARALERANRVGSRQVFVEQTILPLLGLLLVGRKCRDGMTLFVVRLLRDGMTLFVVKLFQGIVPSLQGIVPLAVAVVQRGQISGLRLRHRLAYDRALSSRTR